MTRDWYYGIKAERGRAGIVGCFFLRAYLRCSIGWRHLLQIGARPVYAALASGGFENYGHARGNRLLARHTDASCHVKKCLIPWKPERENWKPAQAGIRFSEGLMGLGSALLACHFSSSFPAHWRRPASDFGPVDFLACSLHRRSAYSPLSSQGVLARARANPDK
jgi:hypothetical protein